MSRLDLVQDAVRPALKARLMLSGPPGAGKTRTGLIMATEIAQGAPILGIDTENAEMLTCTTLTTHRTTRHTTRRRLMLGFTPLPITLGLIVVLMLGSRLNMVPRTRDWSAAILQDRPPPASLLSAIRCPV